jgi:hypothetical protein
MSTVYFFYRNILDYIASRAIIYQKYYKVFLKVDLGIEFVI